MPVDVDAGSARARSDATARTSRSGTPPPGTPRYLRFADERARPFVDLVARVDARAPSHVVDLGCGEGALTASLAQRWPGARVIGRRLLPRDARRGRARTPSPGAVEFVQGDVRDWAPAGPVDVVVSNAVLHWVPGHDRAAGPVGRLAAPRRVAGRPGAGQLPRAHARAAGRALPVDRAGRPGSPPRRPRPDAVLEPAGYFDVLTAAGLSADVWETTYLHVLRGADPVLGWVRSTVLRPVLAARWTTTPPRSSPPSTPPHSGRPIPPGPTARRCCRSGGCSPSATRPDLDPDAHRSAPRPGRLPGRQRGRPARLLRRRARDDRGGQAAGARRAGRGLVPVRAAPRSTAAWRRTSGPPGRPIPAC